MDRRYLMSGGGLLLTAFLALVFLSMDAAASSGSGGGTGRLVDTFIVIFIMSFGVVALMSGLFTAYFGAGKSRVIGLILTLVGLLILLVSVYLAWNDSVTGPIDWGHVYVLEAVLVIVAAGLGAMAGVFLFLLAIMKS